MGYLDRLKGMNSEKCPPLPLQELQKDPSYSFCSSHGARFQKTAPIPPDLAALIQRAATYWEYSPEDLATIHHAARRDPEGLRLALENDVAFRRGVAPC